MKFYGSTVINGILFSTTKETKGHEGKKPKKHPLYTVVTLCGGVFPPETEEPSLKESP
jgi:hypothetical protein